MTATERHKIVADTLNRMLEDLERAIAAEVPEAQPVTEDVLAGQITPSTRTVPASVERMAGRRDMMDVYVRLIRSELNTYRLHQKAEWLTERRRIIDL